MVLLGGPITRPTANPARVVMLRVDTPNRATGDPSLGEPGRDIKTSVLTNGPIPADQAQAPLAPESKSRST